MKFTFQFNVPFEKTDIHQGELYIQQITDKDISTNKFDKIQYSHQKITDDFVYQSKRYELIKFLPQFLRDLFDSFPIKFKYKNIAFEQQSFHWIKLDQIKSLDILLVRKFNSSQKNILKIDIVKDMIQYFQNLNKNQDKRVESLIKKNLQILDINNWEEQVKNKTTIQYDVIIQTQNQFSEEIKKIIYESVRSYLIYLYKMMILFQSKWKTINFDEIKNMKVNFENISQLDSLQIIYKNKDLNKILNFYAIENIIKNQNFEINSFQNNIIFQGNLLKKGEGPLDFNWNSRTFILYNNKLSYYDIDNVNSLKGEFLLSEFQIEKIREYDGKQNTLSLFIQQQNRRVWLSSQNKEELKILKKNIIEQQIHYLNIDIDQKTQQKGQLLFENDLRRFEFDQNNWLFIDAKNLIKIFIQKTSLNLMKTENIFSNLKNKILFILLLLIWTFAYYYKGYIVITITLIITFKLFQIITKKKQIKKENLQIKGELLIQKSKDEIWKYLGEKVNLKDWNNLFQNINFLNDNNFECNFEKFLLKCKVNYEGDYIDFNYLYKNKDFIKILIIVEQTNLKQFSKIIMKITHFNPLLENFQQNFKQSKQLLNMLIIVLNNILYPLKNVQKQKQSSQQINNNFLLGQPFLTNKIENLDYQRQRFKEIQNNDIQISSLQINKIDNIMKNEKNINFLKFIQQCYDNNYFNNDLCQLTLPLKFQSTDDLFYIFSQFWDGGILYLYQAMESENENGKLSNLISLIIQGFKNICFCMKIPIIPQIGETGQFIYSDNTRLDMEMISENSFQFSLFNENGFLVTGKIKINSKLSLGEIYIKFDEQIKIFFLNKKNQNEKNNCTFNELLQNSYYDIKLPSIIIKFIEYGNPIFCLDDFIELQYFQKILSKVKFQSKNQYWKNFEMLSIKGYLIGENEQKIEGDWPFDLKIEEKIYWSSNMIYDSFHRVNRYLPSDVSYNKIKKLKNENDQNNKNLILLKSHLKNKTINEQLI